MKNNFAKWKPYIFLAILLLSLIPLIWLGRYNYPTSRKVAQYFQKTSLYVNYGNN